MRLNVNGGRLDIYRSRRVVGTGAVAAPRIGFAASVILTARRRRLEKDNRRGGGDVRPAVVPSRPTHRSPRRSDTQAVAHSHTPPLRRSSAQWRAYERDACGWQSLGCRDEPLGPPSAYGPLKFGRSVHRYRACIAVQHSEVRMSSPIFCRIHANLMILDVYLGELRCGLRRTSE
jgi:hypothetical protein